MNEEEIKNIDLKKAKEALAETKERIGNERMLELYKEEIKKSNEMWSEIAEKSPGMENLQPCIIAAEVRGITVQEFLRKMKSVYENGRLSIIAGFDPEQYCFLNKSGAHIVLKRFAMYKEPVFWRIEFHEDGFSPAEIDDDTKIIIYASVKSASDGTDTKIIVMHQFKPTEEGFKIKLGVFLPEEAPAQMIDGRKWQLAVEYNNMLNYAVQSAGKK